MLRTIIQAAENFCVHQIREEHALSTEPSKERTLIAYIDIDADDSRSFRVFLACEKEFAQKVTKVFLDEDESDEETLKNMSLELANLIVGSAKVISEESGMNMFTIRTPHFEKIGAFDVEYDSLQSVQVGETKVTIALKELS
ncbi:MAG: chemotaxis protein CheX [Epsilonproteobacteria bacterium]|nr:chemotaxis protein CheX [Campylobacterota bacterium]